MPEQIQTIRNEVHSGLLAKGIDCDEAAAPMLGGNWRRKAKVPVEEYISRCLIVEKETGRLIPFELWDAQKAALEELLACDYCIGAKGRQVGITWLVLALMAWEADSGGNRLFPIARQSEDYAKDAITRLMYLRGLDPVTKERLSESELDPAWLQPIVGKSTTQLTLLNGSSFHALTATQHIGRGFAAYRGLADEFAFWMWQEEQRKALESGCARLDIISTGNGEGDDFHETMKLALAGKGKYRPIFISAQADPRRDADWFRVNVEEDADPAGASREYARTVEDVFRPPSGRFFKRFTREANVREFEVVPGWRTETCADWGFTHPAALLLQISPSGQPFVFDEYLPSEVRTTDFGRGLLEKLAGYRLAVVVQGPFADPAGKARNVQTSRSEFEVFKGLGMHPQGKPSKVSDGVVLMLESIGHPDPERRLIVHPRCVGLIAALSGVQAHRNDPDIYDTDHQVYSHPLDALRYWHICRYRGHRGTISISRSSPGSSHETRGRRMQF